ncbi:CpsD/CapB family tyrosine-protein kinase [Cohnella sp.]|uniref:CpsD/CapB family tyrosine-protein kinase n=1 Tax=Cohnella sp. TaxID=1883426 RepID=UPI00356A92C6
MSRQTSDLVLISDLPAFSLTTESFRTLRTNTQSTATKSPIRMVCVTSCNQGEGKSMTAANLAISYAQQGMKTLLIDADMRSPVLHKTFNIANRAGLSLFLSHPGALDQVSTETRVENLSLLPAGPVLANHIELLSSSRMEALLKEALSGFDRIVIDTPPILPITDAQIVAALCDGVLLVVKVANSRKADLVNAKSKLEQVKANLLGVVLNGQKRSSREKRYSGYGDNH